MKKLLLLAAFGVAGFVSAKENTSNNSDSNKQKQQTFVLTRYLVTIKTVCGTTYQTVFDSEFDSYDCLYNEWEMYNNQDCGHASYENPMV